MRKKKFFIGASILSSAAALAVAVSAAGYSNRPLDARYIQAKSNECSQSESYNQNTNTKPAQAEKTKVSVAQNKEGTSAAKPSGTSTNKTVNKTTVNNTQRNTSNTQNCDTNVTTQQNVKLNNNSANCDINDIQQNIKSIIGLNNRTNISGKTINEICEKIFGKNTSVSQNCPDTTKPNTGSKPTLPQEKPETKPVPPQEKPETKPVPPQEKPELPSTGNFSKMQTEVLDLVNKARRENGLAPLTLDAKLSEVATLKSKDMADLGYFDHTSPTYGSPFDMMKKYGISYTAAGENIAMGQTSSQQVMDGWMNSPGHRANILNSAFTKLGVGIAKNSRGQLYWTQMFIKG